MQEHKKSIIDLMRKAAYSHDTWNVYSDFLELSSVAISNSVDLLNKGEREKRYFEIIKGYTKEEMELFPKMLGELVMALEEEQTDILGEVYQELELANKWRGQFFTPMSICRATGEMAMQGLKKEIDKKGFVTVSEPACGGGAMIIGLAQAMKKAGYNYQQHMLVTAVDVDIKAVHMAYIQLSLLGIPAVVSHGNTLTVEVFSNWYTPFYITGGWRYRKQKEKRPEIQLKVEENGQLSLLNMVG